MSKKHISVLLVGIGGYGANYANEFLNGSYPDTEVVGCVDLFAEKSAYYEALKNRGIAIFKTPDEFWATGKKVDLAILSTPINLHKDGIIDCLRHGAQVLCEKPVCATIDDVEEIVKARNELGGTVSVGYQWSHSDNILQLKQEILDGVYGKPVRFKTLVLWPRDFAYYGRGTGWAGKLTKNGAWTLDSVASNATAHYLHNMFFIAGATLDSAADVTDIEAETYRANAVETYDTCVLRGHLTASATACSVPFFFAVTHAIKKEENYGPVFEYEFEKGTVRMDTDGLIKAYMKDGSVKDYGLPSGDVKQKLAKSLAIARGEASVFCSPETASVHTRVMDAITENRPDTPRFPEDITVRTDERIYVKGLADTLHACYQTCKLPSELGVSFATAPIKANLTEYHHFGLKL